MSEGRVFRWATTSARLIGGTVVAAAAVAGVVVSVSIAWPTVERDAVAVEATPAPAANVMACDGGLVIQGRDLLDPSALQIATVQTLTSGVLPDSPEPETRSLSAPDVRDAEGPLVFTSSPSQGARTDVAASGAAQAAQGDLSGFAATACRPALMESWLVAGSGATGAADFVVLANPGTVAATVQLTVYGATGPQNPPGGADLVIPAGTQQVLPLSGLARAETGPVIRVSSSGAPVQASLQSSITRVLETGGVEQSAAIAAPSDMQRIIGVRVGEEAAAATAGAATVARLLSPIADVEAQVTVSRVGGSGSAVEPVTVPLAAGVPTEVGLTDLAAGEYVIEVSAASPVVAAVWQTSGFGGGSDFAWHQPSPEIDVATLFAVPGGPGAVLTLDNPSEETVTVTLEEVDGDGATEVVLEPGASREVPVSLQRVYLLDPGGNGVHAAVTMAGEGALAAFPVWPADAAAPAIRVLP